MKIPLRVQQAAGGPKPFAYAVIYAPNYKIRGKRIRLFVDTGAHESTICEKDALVLGVRYNRLGRPRKFVGVGGCSIQGFRMKDVILRFRDEKDEVISFNFPEIFVLKSTQKDIKTAEASKIIPSILGMRFLIENGFTFYYDPLNKIAFLEKSEE